MDELDHRNDWDEASSYFGDYEEDDEDDEGNDYDEDNDADDEN